MRGRLRAERGLAADGFRVFGAPSAVFRAAGASGDFRGARPSPVGRRSSPRAAAARRLLGERRRHLGVDDLRHVDLLEDVSFDDLRLARRIDRRGPAASFLRVTFVEHGAWSPADGVNVPGKIRIPP